MARLRTLVGSALALTLAAATATTATADEQSIPGTAGATTVTGIAEPPRSPFYEPPAAIPGTPGTVIRSEPAASPLDALNIASSRYTAQRVMYASKDRLGRPIAVTGLVITPKKAWLGLSKRPVISYAPGTQGMADRCAPTRFHSDSAEYEGLFMSGLLARGYTVALTDYQGLGTPGSHTYMNRQVQGQAVLDMARAAQRLPGSGVTTASPVGIVGYSQGGGAAASAAELHGTYAPELRLKGTVAGAVPADLAKVGANLDGSLYAAFGMFAVVGLGAGYDIDIDASLNAKGRETVRKIDNACVTDLFGFAFMRSSTLTADGKPITELMKVEPYASVLADNRIGRRKPSAPVLLTHSTLDDTIPYAVGKQLAKDWCGKGTNVRWSPNAAPMHIGGMIPNTSEALPWFEARFAGLPQLSNCWTVR